MSEIAISIENLSKQYRIGGEHQGYKTLRDTLAATFSAPFRGLSSVFRGKSTRSDNDTIWALRDVSLQVKRGDVVGIIGRNGAGKTTLLKILSRITEPTEGYAEIHGRVGSLLEVGTGFHPELSGRENIYLNGAILGMRKAEIQGKFDEIVDFAEIDKFIDTPVKHYSSGMYVRLAFAVAAHLEPEILLVDEVLAVGDAAFQKKCLAKMGNIAMEGRTVLFVSHNMAAVDALCGEACLLVDGMLNFRGSTNETITNYLREIRETTTINLGERQDRSGDGKLKLTTIRLEDGKGVPVDTLISGQDACFVIDYEGTMPLKNVSISIGFYGLHGQFLLLCNNEMAGQPFDVLPQAGQLRCLIPKLPFATGAYNINLYCEVNGILADWVQEAHQVSVVEGNYYGTGKGSPASHGGFLAPHRWEHRSTDNS